MKKLTQAQLQKILTETVDKVLNKGIDFNSLVDDLGQNQGVPFVELQKFENVTINKIGLEKGWILTTEQVNKKIDTVNGDNKISHFLDIVFLAKKLEIPQLSQLEKEQAIKDFYKIDSSIISKSAKFSKLESDKIHGKIANYIRENPEFSVSEIIHAGKSMGKSNATDTDDYVNEFLAYREFYREYFGLDLQGNKKLVAGK